MTEQVIYTPKSFITLESDEYLASTAPWNKLVAVSHFVLGIPMYDYQAEILRACTAYDRVACVASRQIGKSVAIAILALAWALSKPNQTVLIISTGERQVKELLTKRNFSIKKTFKRAGKESLIYVPEGPEKNARQKDMINVLARLTGMQLTFSTTHENAEEVEFSNGSRIVVVPANPDTAAGFTADLLIGDEVAKMPNWDDMQAACFPFITRTGGTIALFSSFKGKNHWWELTQDVKTETNPHGWTVLKYDILANPPGNLEQLKHDLPEDVFNEEYMCIPIDASHSLFPYSLVDSCATGTFAELI